MLKTLGQPLGGGSLVDVAETEHRLDALLLEPIQVAGRPRGSGWASVGVVQQLVKRRNRSDICLAEADDPLRKPKVWT